MDVEQRIARLEAEIVRLNESLLAANRRHEFGTTVAGIAMFALSRLVPSLERGGIVPPIKMSAAIHAIFLQLEASEAWTEQDRALVRQWREALVRDDDDAWKNPPAL